jgi:predicted GH43/DUF377 family glycosyl hydrolase
MIGWASVLFAHQPLKFEDLPFAHHIVLSTRQIEFKDYPGAHNPSLIEFEDGYLLTFRYSPDPRNEYYISYIGIVRLDSFFQPVGEPQLLNTRVNDTRTPSQSEDARIFTYRGRLFLIYNDNVEIEAPTLGDRRDMFIAELFFRDGRFSLSTPMKLICAEKYNLARMQKNWVPFEWNKTLLLSYTINPHDVIYPNLRDGECYIYFESEGHIEWDFGLIRGGTPALLVDGEYLSFFHSGTILSSLASWGWEMWHYFMGAYTFSAEPPFKVTKFSPYPIVAEEFYTQGSYWKRVIFPGGFVVKDALIYLAYGKDDSEIWIATIDKLELKKSLLPVK